MVDDGSDADAAAAAAADDDDDDTKMLWKRWIKTNRQKYWTVSHLFRLVERPRIGTVTENDMRKMYSSDVLGIDNPVSLQHKVYVEVALHFCRRGREGLLELTKNSFCEKVDSDGRTYITLGFNEPEKNHQGLGKGDETEEPRMYKQGWENCP